MFPEMFTEDDHVVPGESTSGITSYIASCSSTSLIADGTTKEAVVKTSRSKSIPELWKDIEDIISLDNPQEPGVPKTVRDDTTNSLPGSHKPGPLTLCTPDFSALINDERLISVDTPGTVPRSPGFHVVPKIKRIEDGTRSASPSSPVTFHTLKTVDSSLMETNMLINNSLASGCEFQQYSSTSNVPTLDISRSLNSCSQLELQRVFEPDFDTDNLLAGFGNAGSVLDDMKDRLKYACAVLDIPMDPNTWTVEHVQKWASFVLKQYDRVLESDLFLRLSIDGATLTTMTKEDFVTYFPNVGEMLYSEMEIWCFAFSCGHVMTTPMSNPIMPQAMHQEVTYTDLDSFKTFTYDQPMTTQPQLASQACSASCQQIMPSSMCSTMTSSGSVFVKQEPCDVGHTTMADLSPSSSPECGMAARIPSYTSRPSSCGYTSSEDRFEDHEVKRRVMSRGKQTIQLWQFLKDLLLQPQCFEAYIRWLDRGKGIFKIEDSAHVAKLWGRRKNRPAMNYDKLSRSIRQYYKKGIIKKTGQSKRLVYQFCPQYNG